MQKRPIAERAARLIERDGFASVRTGDLHAFFDVIAEKHGRLYVIKFMENIDALAPAEAEALKKFGDFFDGTALVVGRKCKGESIRSGTAFTRHGVACVSIDAMEEALYGRMPRRARRFIADDLEINGSELQRLRRLYGLSLRELGDRVGLSKDSIHRYESGSESITRGSMARLEEFFVQGLERPREEAGQTHARYGAFLNTDMKSMRLDRDPFSSVVKGRSRYEIGREANYRTMRKWAGLYMAINEMLGDLPFFVSAKKRPRRSIRGVPVLSRSEMERAEGERELQDLIYENADY